ncbi:hypothetical protein, partial [Acinetobacter baumannii]|uniref:hypothetical protein n=1 Tax=Acinetobacter baumannii TaxID=470 RepID=UPI003394C1E1
MCLPSHVGIRGNIAVDEAPKKAIPLDFTSKGFQFAPYSDLRCMTGSYCKRLWQTEWSNQINHKLFQILPDLSASLRNFASTRKEESVFARLLIGHTYVTHSFLLKGEEPPWCFTCDKSFSV